MNSRRLTVGLLLAVTMMLATQPVATARQTGDPIYCIDQYTINFHPDCVPPPTPSSDYRGNPIAVEDYKRVHTGTVTASINVLKNDVIQQRDKGRIEILQRKRAEASSGIRIWVKGPRIFYQSFPGKNGGFLPYGGITVKYQVVDFKGRVAKDTFVSLRVLPKGCGAAGTC